MEVDFNNMLKKSSFIITRFNLKLFSKDKNNKTTLTDQWLKERFELFETYCFPSVEGQVLQNFYWLCLFADDTQEQFKQRAITLHRAFPAFLPLFLNDSESENYLDYINQVISELKDSSDKLITIRLDNDDSININYTKEVDKLYGEQLDNEVCYSFKYGIQYYTKKNFAVRIPYSTNHFLCLLNKKYHKGNIKNILEFNHAYPNEFPFGFKCISNKIPMWIEVVHGRNVDNDCKMTLNQKVLCQRNLLQQYFHVSNKISPFLSRVRIFTFLIPAFLKQFMHRLITKIQSK